MVIGVISPCSMIYKRNSPAHCVFQLTAVPHACDSSMSHLLLQLEDAIHECLGSGGALDSLDKIPQDEERDEERDGKRHTSRYVDINRHNPVTASYDRVTVVVVATTIGTTTHADNPARVGHLIVNLAQGRSHLVRQCTSHNHNIRLSRRSSENDSKSILIITWGGKMHHLHGTACKTEGHGPQRALTSPVGNLIESGPRWMSAEVHGVYIGNEATHKAYCIAPSFFSWLGKGTSVRTLPDAVN
jgi:hypothetical protein